MNKWKERIYSHLEEYKVNDLDIVGKGTYNGRLYGHILPENKRMNNFMCDEATTVSKTIKKHRNWYHLNSSQTMCINFFAPLVEGDYLVPFINSLLGLNIFSTENKFEYAPVEKSTNFDFYAKDEKGTEYFFEIKYTEDTVEKVSKASDVDDAYNKYYRIDLENNKTFKKANITKDMFMQKHYQAYRNMVKAYNGNYSIFIIMEDNPGVIKEINSALKDLNLDRSSHVKENILIFDWRKVVNKAKELFADWDNQKLIDYYSEFYNKYLDF